MVKFGASFSLIRCQELDLDPRALLQAAITDLGVRRFRMMSYWNVHEPVQGQYNLDELDWQLDMVAAVGGTVSLALGKRQPRWPECHIPDWALLLPREEWYQALYAFIETVVKRYKDHPALGSWQLENEALLKKFGHCPDKDFNRGRLAKEYAIVHSLDSMHPTIMTLSNTWGLPLRRPRPDVFGITIYRTTLHKNGKLVKSLAWPGYYAARAGLVSAVSRRPVFIHELQAEPWLNRAVTSTPVDVQLRNMTPAMIYDNVQFALRTGLSPIDLWGLEWWYWMKSKQNHAEYWDIVQALLAKD